jgi:hypothetical protein
VGRLAASATRPEITRLRQLLGDLGRETRA